jgi:ribosomal protein S14
VTFDYFRQALRYIIRNTTLPPRVRADAQLQLSQMHCYTRPTQIRNRCIIGGKTRGVLREFKMSRVRLKLFPIPETPSMGGVFLSLLFFFFPSSLGVGVCGLTIVV